MLKRGHDNADVILSDIGARIQRYRIQNGFTREQLAEASGLSVQSIVKIESGARNFRILSLVSIAQALSLSTDFLLGLSENDEAENIQMLISMLNQDGKEFIKNVIQLYLSTNQS